MRGVRCAVVGLWLVGGLLACGEDAEEAPVAPGADAQAPGGGGEDAGAPAGATAHRLRFEARAGGEAVGCGAPLSLGAPAREVALKDLRFFVSGLEVQGEDGTWAPLELPEVAGWQGGGVALVDLEDATGSCAQTGTPELRREVEVTGPPGPWAGLRFELGVPFGQNHQDPTQAAAPLDRPNMFWVWQSGYKFIRLDLALAEGGAWNLHLGSTGCASPTPVAPPSEPCARPNRPQVTLAGFDPAADRVVLDLSALLARVDLAVNTPDTPPGCMASAAEPADCEPPYAALGLDFQTGACAAAPCPHPAVYAEAAP